MHRGIPRLISDPDNPDGLSADSLQKVDRLCVSFERQWQSGSRPQIERFLAECPEAYRQTLHRELIALEVELLQQAGELATPERYLDRFPDSGSVIGAAFRAARHSGSTVEQMVQQTITAAQLAAATAATPTQLGRYQIVEQIGSGGFGAVYRAKDLQLQRDVAIKIAVPNRLSGEASGEMFLREARLLATLDHPNIVPVYDVGKSDDALPSYYIVSKYMNAGDLSRFVTDRSLSIVRIVEIVAQLADALHAAHQRGLVHRDVKASNILIDDHGNVCLSDFGLAISDDDVDQAARFAGTPSNMSPEQARGEGHLVDGRSDIYSLGVVLFELLTGQRPFEAPTVTQLVVCVRRDAPPSPRELNSRIPEALERICLRAMAKRASDRFQTAAELAAALRALLEASHNGLQPATRLTATNALTESIAQPSRRTFPARAPVIPKGLRAFDEGDRDFFLQLLPGPRDNEGLPEIVRFWKSRLESTDPHQAVRVGVIYGPSGCGKSSLVRAAILPVLGTHVNSVYVEAAKDVTEHRLIEAVIRATRWDEGAETISLTALLKAIRQRRRGKIVLVIDQFEQWLQDAAETGDPSVAEALRQCDGEHVQAILLVRDDFWMPLCRLMHEVELPLAEGVNATVVDLFDLQHARSVLLHFGQAYGRLPTDGTALTRTQKRFLELAVSVLQHERHVTPVQLSVLVELVKSQPWEPATLAKVTSTQDLGVVFLQAIFESPTSAAAYRAHQSAARRVLRLLLPDNSRQLRGRLRSRDELLQGSGYAEHPREFASLLQTLAHDLRIITQVEDARELPSVNDPSETSSVSAVDAPPQVCYQFTHDYLVGAAREWLSRKQRETARGRAELCLTHRSAMWQAKPETKQLPGLLEWLRIRWLTARRDWTINQRQMMQQAGRMHLGRMALLGMLMIATGWLVRESLGRIRAADAMRSLRSARTDQVLTVVDTQRPLRRWIVPRLQEALTDEHAQDSDLQRIELALMPYEDASATRLLRTMLAADPVLTATIIEAWSRYASAETKAVIIKRLWELYRKDNTAEAEMLRAGCALATLAPRSPEWEGIADQVVRRLVREPISHVPAWLAALQPVRLELLDPLEEVFLDEKRDQERTVAATALTTFLADQPERLLELLKVAQPQELRILIERLVPHREFAVSVLQKSLATLEEPFGGATSPDRSEPERRYVETIKNADGSINSQQAFCQSLKLTDLEILTRGLQSAGYRPIRCRPYRRGTETLVAAIWTRDDLPWRMKLGLSPAAVNAELLNARRDKLRPLDVAGYLHHGKWSCALIWVGDEYYQHDFRVNCVTPNANWSQEYDGNRAANFVPQTTHVAEDASRNTFRSQVWLRPGPRPFRSQRSHIYLDDDRQFTAAKGHLLVDISPYARSPSTIGCGAIWHRNLELEAHVVWRVGMAVHRQVAERMLDQAYTLAALAVCETEPGAPAVALSVWHHAIGENEIHQRRAAVRANQAVALLKLRGFSPIRHLLLDPKHQLTQTYILQRIVSAQVEPERLVAILETENQPAIQRFILLALSQYDGVNLDRSRLEKMHDALRKAVAENSNAGVVASADWLTRQWKLPTLRHRFAEPTNPAAGDMLQGIEQHVLAVIQTPDVLPSRQTRVTSPDRRKVAVGTKEVTVEQFLRFRPKHRVDRELSPTMDCPINGVTPYDAMAYCEWLNQQEGIGSDQSCYQPGSRGVYDRGGSVVWGFLARTGYRLPTLDEWKAAANPTAEPQYWFGNDPRILSQYAWYAENSGGQIQPVGATIPTPSGLFDTLGNVAEWIQPTASRDDDFVLSSFRRIGGHYGSTSWQLADVDASRAELPPRASGFRIARTIVPQPADLYDLAGYYAFAEDWQRVAELLGRATEMNPDDYVWRAPLAWVQLYLGDVKAYRRHGQALLKAAQTTKEPLEAHEALLTCLLAAEMTDAELSTAIRLAEANVNHYRQFFQRDLAMAYFRAGRHEEAAQLLRAIIPDDNPFGGVAMSLFVQAMNHEALGNHVDALDSYRAAEQELLRLQRALKAKKLKTMWRSLLLCYALQREAAGKLHIDDNKPGN